MGVFYQDIPEREIEWIRRQKMFWVATAPLSASGHVNVSPKGGPYFDVLSPTQFYYHELSGSGSETIAHLHGPGNARITIQFCAFAGAPKILRLWGRGRVLEIGTPEFGAFVERHGLELLPATRSVIVVDVEQVGTSCGFSVPFYDFREHRPVLNDHFRKKEERFLAGKTEESMDRYWAYNSAWNIDGLPGMKRALEAGRREHVEPMKKMVGRAASPSLINRYRRGYYTLEQAFLVGLVCMFLGWLGGMYGGIIIERLLDTLLIKLKS